MANINEAGGPEGPPDGPKLRRTLSLFDLVVYGLVFINPIGPWSNFGFIFNISGGMVPLVYLVGLITMSFTAISYVTMSSEFPVAGSVYAYATRGIGPAVGFLAGWALLLDYMLNPAMIYVMCAVNIHAVSPVLPTRLLVCLLLGGVIVANLRGGKGLARANLGLLVLELGLLVLFVGLAVAGMLHGVNGAHWSLKPLFNAEEFRPSLLFSALSLAVLAFLGFDGVSTLAEEAKGGPRAVGRATLLALLLSSVLFIVETYLASLFVLNRDGFAPGTEEPTAFLVIANSLGGEWFTVIVSLLGIVLSTLSSAVPCQAAAARLLFGMARDGKLPAFLVQLDRRTGGPNNAILFTAVVTLVIGILLVDNLQILISMVSVGALTGFMALHISVVGYFIVKNGSRRWVRHLVVPIVGSLAIGFVLFNAELSAKLVGLVWMMVGAGVLVLSRRGCQPVNKAGFGAD